MLSSALWGLSRTFKAPLLRLLMLYLHFFRTFVFPLGVLLYESSDTAPWLVPASLKMHVLVRHVDGKHYRSESFCVCVSEYQR